METHRSTRRRSRSCVGVGKALVSIGVVVVFFMIASLLASSASAVPLSRSLQSMDAPLVIPDLSSQDTGSWNFDGYGEEEEEGGEEEEGRKLVGVTNDYGRTGANDKHDPPKRS